ncbi:histidine kinase [Bernardetia sp. Wsw4-3y2]|uniref:tetratricopeptide repeat-containing sensor histidine kinase n=1 Tax=Bernardetia sp. Wsw4-3y2 TaxID=3127471 RepID=UPI0030D0FB5F
MKKLICLLVFSFITSLVLAQDKEIDSLNQLIKSAKGEEKAKLLGKLAPIQYLYSTKDAVQTAYMAWELIKDSDNKKLKANIAALQTGIQASVLHQHDSCVFWARKAIAWQTEIQDSLGLSKTLNNIGNSYGSLEQYDSAIFYYLESIKIDEKLNNPRDLVHSYGNLGMIYGTLKQLDLSLKYQNKAYELAKEGSFQGELLQLSVNLGHSYHLIGESDSSIYYMKKAVLLSEKLNSQIGLYRTQTNLAEYYYLRNENNQALEYINRAMGILEKEKLPNYSGHALYINALILKEKNQYQEAKEKVYQSLSFMKDNSKEIKENYSLLANIYAYLNKPDSVNVYLKKHQKITELLNQQDISKAIATLQTKYETEKKEQQIKDLEQQKTIDELKSKTEISSLQAQRSILGLVLLAPISLLIGGGWYVNRRRLYLKLEAEQKERAKQLSELKALRSQMNPHFIFNALNSIQDFILLSEKENAQHYLGKFATLMRGFLDSSSKEKISLEKELPLLKSYIELEGLRLGEEFSYEIIFDNKIDEEQLEEIEIPPLLIQPYLENAFKHGLLHKMGEKKLLLEFDKVEKQNENFLQLKITDNGIGRQKSAEINARKAKTHQSFATQATEERLELLKNQSTTNKNIEVEINDLKDNQGNGKGTEIVILIPTNE